MRRCAKQVFAAVDCVLSTFTSKRPCEASWSIMWSRKGMQVKESPLPASKQKNKNKREDQIFFHVSELQTETDKSRDISRFIQVTLKLLCLPSF